LRNNKKIFYFLSFIIYFVHCFNLKSIPIAEKNEIKNDKIMFDDYKDSGIQSLIDKKVLLKTQEFMFKI
jgi:hypothetical protein